MIDSWEESQSKSKYRLLVLPVIFLAAVGTVFYMNNNASDSSNKKESSINDIKEIKDSADVGVFSVSQEGEKNLGEISKLNDKIEKSVAVTNIRCGLKDSRSSEILVSLRLYYKDKSYEKEILFKRDEIKFTVQKIMMKKKLEDINVDLLRKELKNEIDNLLGNGKLSDIEFTNFKPLELL